MMPLPTLWATHPKWVTSSVHKTGFVAHFPWQMHILLWLPLGSGRFILVARSTPHMVDVLCRPYQQNQAWNRGQGCPVMTEFIFLCPHVFSIWPSSKCSPFPPQTTREFQEVLLYTFGSKCAAWAAVAQLITACVSGLTLNQQVMCSRESMLQMEKQIKFKRRPGFAARQEIVQHLKVPWVTWANFFCMFETQGCPNICNTESPGRSCSDTQN